jgi:hypothetical protein
LATVKLINTVNTLIPLTILRMERVKGIEPSSQPWEGHILPLNHTRLLEAPSFYQTCRRLATGLPPVVKASLRNG